MMKRTYLTMLMCANLAACGTVDRLKMVGKAPPLSPIDTMDTPSREASLAYQTLTDPSAAKSASTLGNAAPEMQQNTSLFRSSARAFFADQRANRTGDILTVRIRVDDKAQVDNRTSRSRSNSESAGLPALLGLESQLSKVLPNAVNPGNLISGDSQSSSSGNGQIQRRDTVNLTVAAIVTSVLPNGNLVIRGRQEVRVNFEVRELIIAGIVRPEDISRTNTIDHTQIAEARISYGGRGQLTDVQQARYGQQIYDALFPF
jgi:flagellar L-ring protein FlgH